MAQRISKKNQSSADSAYRFGDFALDSNERLFMRNGEAIPIQPKAFDALHCLVRNADHLVSKQELTDTLWPSIHVSESNLTNTIVSLRKIVGRAAIRTVSKHGYRFILPVAGEPGIARATYERFTRAKELTAQRSIPSMSLARELYFVCVAENPTFAPAWAWLGRCCWFLGKFCEDASANLELAEAAFQRAFALDPDLASAHQFYTLVQADSGEASSAMVRLLQRVKRHPGEPESFTGLVQVLRFRGLLEESIGANSRAADLDPTVITSVAHTLFLLGDYAAAIEAYSGRAAYYLDAAAWAALGNQQRAKALLRERLAKMSLSKLMKGLMSSLLALLLGKRDEAVRQMETTDTTLEPEILIYFARHYTQMGLVDAAIKALRQAPQLGMVCAPMTLNKDAWLAALRKHNEFPRLLSVAEMQVAEARSTYERYVDGESPFPR